MNLTNETIESTYGNLLTIGDAAGTPTQGTLQNGNGQDVTSLTLDELQVNKLVQTQATIAASGTSLAGATLLTAGVNLVTSADSNNIAVKLPQSQLGLVINVVNTSGRNIIVFPYAVTDSILGLNAGEGYVVPNDGQLYRITCVQNPNVGVWSVLSPATGSAPKTLLYTQDVTIDSSSPTSGGVRSTTGDFGSPVASVQSVYSGGTVISRELVLGTNNPGALFLDWGKLTGYTEYRIKRFTVKTNVPAGDLTSSPSQLSNTLMGLTSSQFGTMKIVVRSSYWDDTVFPNSQMYSIGTMERSCPTTYSNNYATNNAPASYNDFKHYIAQPSDLAYSASGGNNNRYLKLEISAPTSPSSVPAGFNTSIYAWSRMFDDNGNPIVYHQLNLVYGSQYLNQNTFPSGFEFKGTFELEIEVR